MYGKFISRKIHSNSTPFNKHTLCQTHLVVSYFVLNINLTSDMDIMDRSEIRVMLTGAD